MPTMTGALTFACDLDPELPLHWRRRASAPGSLELRRGPDAESAPRLPRERVQLSCSIRLSRSS